MPAIFTAFCEWVILHLAEYLSQKAVNIYKRRETIADDQAIADSPKTAAELSQSLKDGRI